MTSKFGNGRLVQFVSASVVAAMILCGAPEIVTMAKAADDQGKNVTTRPSGAKRTTPTPEQERNAESRMPMLDDVCDFPGDLPPDLARKCKGRRPGDKSR